MEWTLESLQLEKQQEVRELKLATKRKSDCIIEHVSPKEICSSDEGISMFCYHCEEIYNISLRGNYDITRK